MSQPCDMDGQSENSINFHRAKSSVNYITFNQDASCVALGLDSGYQIYSCKPSIRKCSYGRRGESIGIIEMLYCSSLVAIVNLGEELGSSPRKLKILNTKRQTTICDLIFPSTILSVKLSHKRMIVLLEEQIFVYDIRNMNLLHTIETSPNLNSLCALSDTSEATDISLLAYPSPPRTVTHESLLVNGVNTNGGLHSAQNNIQSVSNTPNRVGDAIIFNLTTLQPLAVIEAHKSALSAMCLSKDGTLLATASDKGTILRVFDVRSGVKLFQFRRGTYPTKIYSIAFSGDNEYVIATSSSETVHIFRLGEFELLANKQMRVRNSSTRVSNKKFIHQTIEEEASFQSSPRTGDSRSMNNLSPTLGDEEEEIIPRSERKSDDERSTGENNADDLADDLQDIVEDEGDDSDIESDDFSDDGIMDLSKKQRKLSQSSSNSFGSLASGYSNISGGDEQRDRSEPVVDQNRLSVARLIRRSSQHLGRKAAQKMGDYLPSRFSSILEPTRHFASLKLQTVGKDVKSIAIINSKDNEHSDLISAAINNGCQDDSHGSNSMLSLAPLISDPSTIFINVVTSEGYYYIYALDSERGGDCILLQHYFLLDD